MSKRSKTKRRLGCGRMEMQRYENIQAGNRTADNLEYAIKAEAELMFAQKTGITDGLTTIPAWKRAEFARKQAAAERLMKNGITAQDMDEEYQRGRRDATKEYVDQLLPYQQKFFYSAAAIAAHDLFGFGSTRVLRLLDRIQQIMCEEISTGDIIDRAKKETGVDIFVENYTI